MSITERPLQEINRNPELTAPIESRRTFIGMIPFRAEAARMSAVALVSGAIIFTEGCAPAKTEQEQKAEDKMKPALQLFNRVMEWETVKDNPDRAVTMALGGLQSKEGIDPIFRDYHRSRQEMGITEDQSAVLSVAANINEHNYSIEETVGKYKTFRDVHQKSESQAAGLASIAVINDRGEDEIDRMHDSAVEDMQLNPDQAVPFVQYSMLLGGSDRAAELFIKMQQEGGFSVEDSIVLMPAVMLAGDIQQVKTIRDEIKSQVAEGTPDDVLSDLTVATIENDNDTASVIYMYNYGGGGYVDHCRSVRLTQGTAIKSSSIMANRPNLAPAMINHTYGQGAIRGASTHGANFHPVSARPGVSGSRVSSQGSSRPSSGSYGTSVKSSPSFSGGRGGVSSGGASGGG